jgi:hypothetical protein
VIQAMIDRQREQDGDSGSPTAGAETIAVEDSAGKTRVVFRNSVRFEDIAGERAIPILRFPAEVPPGMAKALELGSAEQDVAVTSAAYFVACTTAEHVPDHWRNKSPIGRDFIRMPRHRMLSFHPDTELLAEEPAEQAAEPEEPQEKPKKGRKKEERLSEPAPAKTGPRPGRVKLFLPELLSLELEPGERHDLLVGIAAEIGGRYYMIVGAEVENLSLPAGEEVNFLVTVKPEHRTGFNMEIGLSREAELPDQD